MKNAKRSAQNVSVDGVYGPFMGVHKHKLSRIASGQASEGWNFARKAWLCASHLGHIHGVEELREGCLAWPHSGGFGHEDHICGLRTTKEHVLFLATFGFGPLVR